MVSVSSKRFSMDQNLLKQLKHICAVLQASLKKLYLPVISLSRINQKYPYPILRHRFGGPTLTETYDGIREMLLEVLDVISIGPDQNAQENFMRQTINRKKGAGGVPVRTYEDMEGVIPKFEVWQLPFDAVLCRHPRLAEMG
ncbi:MAG: hypothetical protein U0Z17_10105 [Bacteroidales bacterium]